MNIVTFYDVLQIVAIFWGEEMNRFNADWSKGTANAAVSNQHRTPVHMRAQSKSRIDLYITRCDLVTKVKAGDQVMVEFDQRVGRVTRAFEDKLMIVLGSSPSSQYPPDNIKKKVGDRFVPLKDL